MSVGEMHSGIFALVVIDVNGDVGGVERLSIGRFHVLEIGAEDVVGLSGWNPLGEFAVMIGINLPLRLLVFGAANFYGNAVNGSAVRSPDGAENQCIRLVFGLVGGKQGQWSREDRQHERTDCR